MDKLHIDDIISRFDEVERELGDLEDLMWIDCYDGEDTEIESANSISDIVNADYWEFGMSKVCFFFNDYPDIVVKIPIKGCHVFKYNDDECDCEPSLSYSYTYKNAKVDGGLSWDYCRSEEYFYGKAVEFGVDEMFAETACIGETKNGYPVYASKKISNCCSSMTRAKRQQYLSIIKNSGIQTQFLGKTLIADMMDSHPLQLVIDTIRFLHNFNIDGDMHSGNYMYDEDGNLVFIDYSDFNDHTEDF